MRRQLVSVASAAAAGLVAMTVLSLASEPVQAEPMLVSAAQLTPSGNQWWFSGDPAEQDVFAHATESSIGPVPNNAFGYGVVDLARAVRAGSVPRAAPSAERQVGRSSSVVGRILLVAAVVAVVAAVGAFAARQVRARSRRRSPVTGNRRSRDVYDWRTLPPKYENDPADDEVPFADHEGYGPLWRYGAPQGSGRDYDLGHDPGYRPAHGQDRGLAFGPGSRLPWGFPDDAPRDEWS